MTDARRLVTPTERVLVQWLLEHAPTGPVDPALLPTIDKLHVIESCDCGCPSIEFVREGMGAGAQVLAEATGSQTDGSEVTIQLWGKDGVISGLEVFSYDGGTWFPLPPIDRLMSGCPAFLR